MDRTHLYTLFHPDRSHSRSYSSTRRLLVSLRSFPDKPCVSSWTGVLETDTGSGQKKIKNGRRDQEEEFFKPRTLPW